MSGLAKYPGTLGSVATVGIANRDHWSVIGWQFDSDQVGLLAAAMKSGSHSLGCLRLVSRSLGRFS